MDQSLKVKKHSQHIREAKYGSEPQGKEAFTADK